MNAKFFPGLILVSCCSLVAGQSAFAGSLYPNGLYGWYDAGATVVPDAKIKDFFGASVTGNPVKFDPGFHFGIGIGQEFNRFVKVEVESGFNYNAVNSIEGATASSANVYRVPVMGNVVVQYPNSSGLIPYFGAGVGAQWTQFDAQNVALGTTTLNENSETWVFGYQGFAGVRYQFRESMSLGLSYHYSVADAPSWTFSSVPGGNFKLDAIRTHSLSLAFGWTF